MADGETIRYEIDLADHAGSGVPIDPRVRSITRDDRDELADVMLDGHRGTIDYAGEDLDDALAEIDWYFESTPLLDHSFVFEDGGAILAAVLVLLVEGRPLFGYAMTRADHKRNGHAGTVTETAVRSLADAGYERAVLYITDGNTPSEALARRVGAQRRAGTR